MSRPPLEVADLVRAAGDAFIERSRKWITWKHVKVLLAIASPLLTGRSRFVGAIPPTTTNRSC